MNLCRQLDQTLRAPPSRMPTGRKPPWTAVLVFFGGFTEVSSIWTPFKPMASKNFRADGAEALKRLRAGAGTGDDSKKGAKHKEVWWAGEEFTGLGAAASMGPDEV